MKSQHLVLEIATTAVAACFMPVAAAVGCGLALSFAHRGRNQTNHHPSRSRYGDAAPIGRLQIGHRLLPPPAITPVVGCTTKEPKNQ